MTGSHLTVTGRDAASAAGASAARGARAGSAAQEQQLKSGKHQTWPTWQKKIYGKPKDVYSTGNVFIAINGKHLGGPFHLVSRL